MGMPIGEDVLTIIMGLDDPCEPGMHGKVCEPGPSDDAVGLVTKIRDMCDKWLRSAGKAEGSVEKPDSEQSTPDVGDTEDQE